MPNVEESVELELLRSRMVQYAKRARALGVAPGVEMGDDGSLRVVRTLPRELREMMRGLIASVGVGVLTELALDSDDEGIRLGAVRTMMDVGLGRAKTHMSGEGELVAAGVVMFPVVPTMPQPPDALRSGDVSSGHTLAPGARVEPVEEQRPDAA